MATVPRGSFISNSESMSRFGFRCVLFFAPLLCVLAFAAIALDITGELMSNKRVLELQESAFVLYEPLYQPKSVYPSYKLLGTLKRHPDVLALGTSRIFMLHNEFVRESG